MKLGKYGIGVGKYADVTGNCVEENIYERLLRGLFTI